MNSLPRAPSQTSYCSRHRRKTQNDKWWRLVPNKKPRKVMLMMKRVTNRPCWLDSIHDFIPKIWTTLPHCTFSPNIHSESLLNARIHVGMMSVQAYPVLPGTIANARLPFANILRTSRTSSSGRSMAAKCPPVLWWDSKTRLFDLRTHLHTYISFNKVDLNKRTLRVKLWAPSGKTKLP
jgi:hypothetical protein